MTPVAVITANITSARFSPVRPRGPTPLAMKNVSTRTYADVPIADMICLQPLTELLPYVDAMNIDLKGFNQKFYDWIGGDLETVKQTIQMAHKAGCHVEITTLVIPGM